MLITTLLEPLQLLSACKTTEVEHWKVHELQKTAKWVAEVPQSLIKAQELIADGRLFLTARTSLSLSKLAHLRVR
jgi:hypothetical protein